MDEHQIMLHKIGVLGVCAASVYSLIKLKHKKRRKRRYATQPMNRNRHTEGQFQLLVKHMEDNVDDYDEYFAYTRMTPDMFAELIRLIKPHHVKTRQAVLSLENRLMITLHYLSEGSSMADIACMYKVGKATVYVVLNDTLLLLIEALSATELPTPTQDDWRRIADGFDERWDAPNCVGACVGKDFGYKQSTGHVLIALCDADYRFVMAEIDSIATCSDSTVFKENTFGKKLLAGELDLPPPNYLPDTCVPVEYYIAADNSFPLHKHIMRPYPPKECLDETKTLFNYRLGRARSVAENAVGVLQHRWAVLRKPLLSGIEMCEGIVRTTLLLHNYVMKREGADGRYCPDGFVDCEDFEGNVRYGSWRDKPDDIKTVGRLGTNNSSRRVQTMRDTLANYFESDVGRISCQSLQMKKLFV